MSWKTARQIVLAGLVAAVAILVWWFTGPWGPAERLGKVERRLDELERRLAQLIQALEEERPRLLASRLSANETAAIATFRNVVSAQAQFQQSAKADADNDGTGEYGGFLELSGASPGRMTGVLVPPVLSGAFRVLDEHGVCSRSGYRFRMYLPGLEGGCVAEPPGGFTPTTALSTASCEEFWCCYAWPVPQGTSGVRTFFVNQGGDVLSCSSERYGGSGGGPVPDAAFAKPGGCRGAAATDAKGADGNVWSTVR